MSREEGGDPSRIPSKDANDPTRDQPEEEVGPSKDDTEEETEQKVPDDVETIARYLRPVRRKVGDDACNLSNNRCQ